MARKRDLPPLPETTPLPPLVNNDRLTIIHHIYREHMGEDPYEIGGGQSYSELLENMEDVYSRRLKATSNWGPIDFGWVDSEKVGCIVIENIEGKGLTTIPSEEEKKTISERIIELSYSKESTQCDLVKPGEMASKRPAVAGNLYIRSQGTGAQYRVHVIAK